MQRDLDTLKKKWRSLDNLRLPDDMTPARPALPRLQKTAYLYVLAAGTLAPVGGVLLTLFSPLFTGWLEIAVILYFGLIALAAIWIYAKGRRIDFGTMSATGVMQATARIRRLKQIAATVAALSLAIMIVADAVGRGYFNSSFVIGAICGLVPALIIGILILKRKGAA